MGILNTQTMQHPIPYEVFLALHPNTSFPPGEDFVLPDPFVRVLESAKPDFVYATQQCREAAPVLVDDKWVQGWSVIEIFATQAERDVSIAAAQAAQDANVRLAAQKERDAAVDVITVTTASGKVFDGNEASQGRMQRAIATMAVTGAKTIPWVLAGNKTAKVGAADLTEALSLAFTAQAAIWVIK